LLSCGSPLKKGKLMRKTPSSKSGLLRPRTWAALGLFSIAVILATYRVVAVPMPASGTLTSETRTITYTDGPLASNPTHLVNGTPICNAPNSCSDFTLTVNASSLAATHNVTWTMQWPLVNVDVDIFILKDGQLVSANIGYSDPATLALSIPADGTVYHLIAVCSVGSSVLNGTVSLTPKYPTAGQGPGAPPRYINYPSGPGQATIAGEPSIGVDWNPNVPALKHDKVNTGGVAFFTAINDQWRSSFDDCSSPAVNLWEDMNSPIVEGLDPIGFVDHFSTVQLGISYPPPKTPGRVFALQLAAGSSTAAFSDNDGGTWVSFVAGGPPAGPDHETLGGGPFHAPLITPPPPAYPNATYYCSQFGVENASCSRSDDGGLTFGPGVPIFPPQLCAGGIHGHIKVSPQGTAYVPNAACGEGTGPDLGVVGVALSKDNGITWTHQSIPGSTGSADPAVGIGQNNVGKPPGQVPNTLYLGYISADGHAHAAHSPDEGETWQDDIDISSIFGIEKAVFPAMVAGDDNRAALSFLGTDPAFYPAKQVWHLYIAHTYDGGKSWILIDQTPTDPVQIGTICLLGTGCSGGRNLLDFMGIDVDAEGRVLVAYADGCLNCANNQPTNQSTASKGVIARQSGGRRLFSAFDPVEPAVPAAPQLLSAVRTAPPAAPGVLVSWREPDNGGSPIIGYNIYRGQTPGSVTFLTGVAGATTNKYLDETAPNTSNWYYRVTAVNALGEGDFCREVNVDGIQPFESACVFPYLTKLLDPAGDQSAAPLNTQEDIRRIAIGEPFLNCVDQSLTFLMKVQTLAPTPPPSAAWMITFKAPGTTNTLFVQMDTQTSGTPGFNYGYLDGNGAKVVQCGRPNVPSCPVTGSHLPDGTIVMQLDRAAPLKFFGPTNTGATPDFTVNLAAGAALTDIAGRTELGAVQVDFTTGPTTYTTAGNISCSTQLPVAVLTASPLSGPVPLAVNFDASQSHTDNPCAAIVSYTLDFGDGSAPVTQASAQFSHLYTSAGFYAARLTVTDAAGQVSENPAEVVIVAKPAIQWNPATYTVDEDGGSVTLTSTRSGGGSSDVSVSYSTEDGTAQAGLDYTSKTGQLTFPAGGPTSQTVTIPITEDTAIEGAESFKVTLTADDEETIGSPQTATVTIHDNDPSSPSPTPTPSPAASPSATPVATPTPTPSPAATPSPTVAPTATPSPTATASATPTPTPTASPTPTPSPSPAQLLNISARMRVQTDDNVLIAGVIITGNGAKKVLFRALGPSLKSNNVPIPGRLADPVLELRDRNGALVTSNDDWKDSPQRSEIEASGVAPEEDEESVILRTLDPNPYTAIVRGKDRTTGIGLIEAYDLDTSVASVLANISTRGFVETNDNVMIGGFIAGNHTGNTRILVRALGPSLKNVLPNALDDTFLELHDRNGATVATNDNWKENQRADIEATGIPPSHNLESAMVRTVIPDAYTVIVRGKNNSVGVGLVEIYNIK
jgi:PKD repeat protein